MTDHIENKITLSKDGRFLIHKTIFTHIMPSDYYRAILANALMAEETEYSDEEIKEIIREGREYLAGKK